ncbi:uncharacterized protein LOC144096826 [Amblyomma americanum]
MAPVGDPSALAAPNQVTGYDPQSLQIVRMDTHQSEDTTQGEDPLPTEDDYLQDMVRVWRGKKNAAAASRDAGTGATQQQAPASSAHTQGASALNAASKSSKQLRWRPQNTPCIEKDDIVVVVKPRNTVDLKTTFGPGRAGAAVHSILGDDANAGLEVWPVWDQNVLVCVLISVDAAEKLLRDIVLPVGEREPPFPGHRKLSGAFCRGVVTVSPDETSESVKRKLSAEQNVVSVRKLGGTPVAVVTFAGTKVPRMALYSYERLPVRLYKKTVPACHRCGTVGHRADACPRPQPGRCKRCGVQVPDATPDGPAEHDCVPSCLICGGGHPTGAPGCVGRFQKAIKPSSPSGSTPKTKTGPKQAPPPKAKKAPADQETKAKPGTSKPVKSVTQAVPPVLNARDFPPLAPVQPQVSSWSRAVSGPPTRPSPTETAVQQQVEELRCQNQILAHKIQEIEAEQAGSSGPMQEAEPDDEDDGSSVTSCLTSVSRQCGDTVVGSAGRVAGLEALQRQTEQLKEQVAAFPNQIMSAVRESFQDMFKAALTQALPDLMAQVTDSVLRAVKPWVSTQNKNATSCESPHLKRKTASRQAAEEHGSRSAAGGSVRPIAGVALAPGQS